MLVYCVGPNKSMCNNLNALLVLIMLFLGRAQSMAGVATVVVVPHRARVRARGSPHEDPEGRESTRTALPPVAVPEHLP